MVDVGSMTVVPQCPSCIGLQGGDGKMIVLIKAGEKLPFEVTLPITNTKPMMKHIPFRVYQGDKEMCDETEAYLYAASRAQNVRAVVRPALLRGDAVVCDRFVDSSVAYQGAGRQLGMEEVAALNAMAVGGTMPDITVYLRMPADAALSRRLSASEPDRLERQKADFFSRTGQAYERIFAGREKRVMTVNAAQSIERVTQEMLDGLDERLKRLDV